MIVEANELTVNGIVYVPKDSISNKAESFDGMPYVIVRTYSAGVFAGYLAKREGKEGVIKKARRLWKWSGAASLSQLAVDGTCKPKECIFPCPVDQIELTEIIEILGVTEKAKKSIESVEIWEMK